MVAVIQDVTALPLDHALTQLSAAGRLARRAAVGASHRKYRLPQHLQLAPPALGVMHQLGAVQRTHDAVSLRALEALTGAGDGGVGWRYAQFVTTDSQPHGAPADVDVVVRTRRPDIPTHQVRDMADVRVDCVRREEVEPGEGSCGRLKIGPCAAVGARPTRVNAA